MTEIENVRTLLNRDHGTDFGVTDEQIAAQIDQSKAYVRESGRRWSWTVLAAEAIVRAARGPDE